jgi:hypothetical protein
MNKSTILADGKITKADTLRVELHQPVDHPAIILLRWPEAPSVCDPDPRAVSGVAASIVRILAEAQARLAKIRAAGL